MSCGRAARGACCLTTCRQWGTIYRWFAARRDDERFERVNHALVMADRERVGATPAAPRRRSSPAKASKAAEAGGRVVTTLERRSTGASSTPKGVTPDHGAASGERPGPRLRRPRHDELARSLRRQGLRPVQGAVPRRRRGAWLRAAPPRRRGHLRLHDHGRTAAPGACSRDDAARRSVERAVGTEEGALW
jgi:hypothetical protein